MEAKSGRGYREAEKEAETKSELRFRISHPTRAEAPLQFDSLRSAWLARPARKRRVRAPSSIALAAGAAQAPARTTREFGKSGTYNNVNAG